MHVVARARHALARHPWLHRAVVASLALAVAAAVWIRLAEVDRARDRWGVVTTVYVAIGDQPPGAVVEARPVQWPLAVVPDAALRDPPTGARLRQHVVAGELLVSTDVTSAAGPAALAPAGSVVVGLVDPIAAGASIGLRVHVASEGVVLAEAATVVSSIDSVIYVAVDADEAGPVSAAGQAGTATLLFLP